MKLFVIACALALAAGCGGSAPDDPFWHFYARSQTDMVICEGAGHMPGTWYGSCGYWVTAGPNPPPPKEPYAPVPVVVFAGNTNDWSLSTSGAFTIQLGTDQISCPTPSTWIPNLYLEASCGGFNRTWLLYATGD